MWRPKVLRYILSKIYIGFSYTYINFGKKRADLQNQFRRLSNMEKCRKNKRNLNAITSPETIIE